MVTRSVKFLILLHMCISLGGMLIHLKLHPVGKSLYFLWASPVSAFSLLVIPFLYLRSSTVSWGFMLNAATVLMGTIGMSYYFLLNFEGPLTLSRIIMESTLPGILILWSKVPIAYFILLKMKPETSSRLERGCVEWKKEA